MLNCAMWVRVWFRSTFQECPELLSLMSEIERTSGRPLRGSRFLVITVMGFSIEIRAWTSISILREEQGSIINMGLSQIFLAMVNKIKLLQRKSLKFLLETAALACVRKQYPHP